MKHSEEIEKELTEISGVVARLDKNNLFIVPNGYFEAFPQKMLSLALAAEYDLSAADEIAALSPLLAGLKNKKTLQVPEDYFATLAGSISSKTGTEDTEAKVISLGGRKRSWIRYAAAAVITGAIGISAMYFLNTNNTKKTIGMDNRFAAVSLPELSDTALASYLNTIPASHDQQIDSADTEFYDMALLKIQDEKGLVGMLKDISDEDLDDYSKENMYLAASL